MARVVFVAALILFLLNVSGAAQSRVEENVVYGSYSGLALLMNVLHPEEPNGYGLVLIPGSGWHAPQTYDAVLIKDGTSALFGSVPRLLEAGYTLFVVNHRAAPRFRYPAAVEDVQRAVRFVRYHAAEYRIDPDRIGAVGYSSGGHLALLLGVLPDTADPSGIDPVDRMSSRVQGVVASAAPADLENMEDDVAMVSFLGMPAASSRPDPIAAEVYQSASPVARVSRTSAPLLLIYGDADEIVRFSQGMSMLAAAEEAGAPARLIRVPGGDHRFGASVGSHPEWPDIFGETVRWLDKYLGVSGR